MTTVASSKAASKLIFSIIDYSPLMWLIVVIFMLLDVHGWRVYFWMSFLPLIMVLVIGTKLEVIVANMAVAIKDSNSVIRGSPLVEPNDKHFWFCTPRFLLTVLHYTLFLNTFEIAFFVWITWKFGINSCYHEHRVIVVTRLVLAVTVQVLSSYITLPLYAIVTQMGSSYKRAILEEDTANVLRRWHGRVRNERKGNQMSVTGNNGDKNDVGIDSRENQNQPEVVYDFRFSGRQPPILQEIPRQMTPKGDRIEGEEEVVGSEKN